MQHRVIVTRRPVDLRLTLGPLCHGGKWDPCVRIGVDGVWRASDTAIGPATVHLGYATPTTITAQAWGPGAELALAEARELVGADDDPPSLAGIHPLVTEIERRTPGLRVGRTGALVDALVPTVLAQKVIGIEAATAYRSMVRASGRRAPTPPHAPALFLPPEPGWLVSTPYWEFHRWGVEQRRALTVKTVATHAHRLGEAARLSLDEARRRMLALPGVGTWTANSVAMIALGDPDAVSVGDFWLKHIVSYALTGEPRGTDERMLELLEPWAGQRGRVCRLLMHGGPRLPRFGPRLPLRAIARH